MLLIAERLYLTVQRPPVTGEIEHDRYLWEHGYTIWQTVQEILNLLQQQHDHEQREETHV